MRQYLCKRIKENIKIDGDLSKLPWKDIEGIGLVETCTGKTPRLETEVKVVWNDDFLYFSFKCQDDFIKATMTEYNDKLYEEDVVEVFIDDNNNLNTYVEIEVNPLNAILHYLVCKNFKNEKFCYAKVEKSILSATEFDNVLGIWNTEISIPMKEFTTAKNNPPIPGDKWNVNFYRIDRPENKEDEYSAWSPTGQINFHMPEKFGELIFR